MDLTPSCQPPPLTRSLEQIADNEKTSCRNATWHVPPPADPNLLRRATRFRYEVAFGAGLFWLVMMTSVWWSFLDPTMGVILTWPILGAFPLIWIYRKRAPFLVRAVHTEQGGDLSFPVRIILFCGGVGYGHDTGWVTFCDGWLVYEGLETAFALSPTDITVPQPRPTPRSPRLGNATFRDYRLVWRDHGQRFRLLVQPYQSDGSNWRNAAGRFNSLFTDWRDQASPPAGCSLTPPVAPKLGESGQMKVANWVVTILAFAFVPGTTVLLVFLLRSMGPYGVAPFAAIFCPALLIPAITVASMNRQNLVRAMVAGRLDDWKPPKNLNLGFRRRQPEENG